MQTPRDISGITTEWLNAVLGQLGEIVDSRASGLGAEETGFLSTMAKAELTWASSDETLPSTIVIKIPPPPGEFHEISENMHAFQREARFYKEIAPGIETRVPHIFHASATHGEEVIIMEDLSWMTPCDQIKGMSHEWICKTVAEIGTLQARYWDNLELSKLDWVPWEWKDNFYSVAGHEEWEAFRNNWKDIIGQRGIEMAYRVEEARDWIDDRMRSRPKTLLHSDLRADNVMMDESGIQPQACIIDWQLVSRGIGAVDLARLFGGSDLIDDRAGHHMEVIRAWHDALVMGGVHGYSIEDATDDFLLSALIVMRIPAFASSLSMAEAEAESRTGQLIRSVVLRFSALVEELDALRVLPS